MREVNIGTTRHTAVVCLDEPGPGGACHEYKVGPHAAEGEFAKVSFQNGPIGESGVNGCQNEDLIAIAIDRLQYFQKGNFSCRENAIAITKLEEALLWLNKRTNDRIVRGVEGKSII